MGDFLGLADGLAVGIALGFSVGVDVAGDLFGFTVGAILGLSELRSQTVALYVVVVREAHPALVELKNPNNFHVGRIDVV